MTRRRQRAQDEQPQDDTQSQPPRGDKAQQAKEKLARMEATNKICFRLRTDFAKLEEELKQFGYKQAELDHILEPKGAKNIPGYSFTEMEAQRQFVHRLSTRSAPAESHATDVDESQQQDGELVR